MVARDWRGGKVFYREWSKLGVERTLGALNGWGDYWRTSVCYPISRLKERNVDPKTQVQKKRTWGTLRVVLTCE
jgi:hypothetical protein